MKPHPAIHIKTVLALLLSISAILTSCNSKENAVAEKADKAMIPPDKMLPPAEAFGDGCAINNGMSDKRARAIIDGTFERGGGGGDMRPILCVYKNPNAMVEVTWCEEVSSATAKLQKGIEATKRSVEIQDLESYGVDGFQFTHKGKPGCRFRFGNVIVDISGYSSDEQDKIIKSFLDHYTSIAE